MGKRVLIIDDDPEIIEIIEEALRAHDYDVVSAQDGLRGIEKTNEKEIDLILLDLRMPYFSGLWFCNAFRERARTKDIPVVIISGLASEEEIQKAYRLGAKAYIKKPFRTKELLQVVEKTVA